MSTRVIPEGHLHAVVDAIAAAGSQALARRAAGGAAVPFDLVESRADSGAPLFSYQPRTLEFVEEHVDALRQLPAWPAAVNVLAGFDHLGDYLLSHGIRSVPADARERADLVLRVLLADMHADTGDFQHTPGRARAAADGLARCVLGGKIECVVVVPLLGVRLAMERLPIDAELSLIRDDVIDGLPRDARSPVRGRPGTLAVVQVLEDPTGAAGLALARPRLRRLLSALRLYDAPAPALAPVAWSRTRGGGWASHPFVGTAARATGLLEIEPRHGDAIRGFVALLGRGERLTGNAAWALRRFELGCERADHGEALTDVLLGLRALLGPRGPLGPRLAALCARPGEDVQLHALVDEAVGIEDALMRGQVVDPVVIRGAVVQLRGHLRALLRDVACGHLPADLEPIAERHLLRAQAADAPVAAQADAASAVDATTDERDAPGIEQAAHGEPVAALGTPSDATSAVPPPNEAAAIVPQAVEPAAAGDAELADLIDADPDVPEFEPATADRERVASGERFEDAFLRSLEEGPAPSAEAAGDPSSRRGLLRRRRAARPRSR